MQTCESGADAKDMSVVEGDNDESDSRDRANTARDMRGIRD